MSIPPTDPTESADPNIPYANAGAAADISNFGGGSFSDPAGVWQKFLSMSGSPASKKDVEQFFKTLLNFYSLMIKQSDEAHKRAMQQQKDVISGNQ